MCISIFFSHLLLFLLRHFPSSGENQSARGKDTVDSQLWVLSSHVSQALVLEIITNNLANVLTFQEFAEPIPLERGEARDRRKVRVKDPGISHHLVRSSRIFPQLSILNMDHPVPGCAAGTEIN